MAKKRKVNAPVREQQRQKAIEKRTRIEKNYKPQTAAAAASARPASSGNLWRFLAVMGVIVVVAGGGGTGLYYFNKSRTEPTPWTNYEDRLKITPTVSGEPLREYRYPDREVKFWVRGAKDPKLPAAEFERLVSLATKWLTLEDATSVLEAAAAAHSDRGAQLVTHAQTLTNGINSANPESRDCKVRLNAIIEKFAEPAPEPTPEPTLEPAETPAEPAPDAS